MKKEHWIIRTLKHPTWDLFALTALIGGVAADWIAGVGAVIWFGTILLRRFFSS